MSQKDLWTTEKRSLRDVVKTLIWSSKFGYRISPTIYTLKFVNRIFTASLPLIEAYSASQIVGSLVKILSSDINNLTSTLLFWVIITVVIMVLRGLNNTFGEYLTVRYNYIYNLKGFGDYLRQIIKIDAQYHENSSFKTLQEKAYDVLSWRIMAIINRIQGLTANIFCLLLISYIFFQINPLFLLAVILPVLLNFYINKKFGREIYYIWEYSGEEAKNIDQAFHAFDDKSIIHEAKIYGFGEYIINIFEKYTKIFTIKNVKKANTRYSLLSLAKLAEITIFGFIQYWLIIKTIVGKITIQQYTFYLQNVVLVNQSFNSIQEDLAQLFELSQYVSNLEKFFNLPDITLKPTNPVKVTVGPPKIEFKNVSFKYPSSNNYVLNNVSFEINPGEHVALVGANGAGKTTIIKLLARFYDVTNGEILINGINIKKLDLKSYYKLWGILFQHFARYWLTLRENIGLGAIDKIKDKEKIESAAIKAGLNQLADNLPKKYETNLSTDFKNGTDLSGGQWQKVGIARGLFSDPQLIVLDEPTSALDALAEAEVFEQIDKISSDTTMIIVSHRFSTVRNADRILVLENGVISEEGTHLELMANKRLYYKMFTTQAKGYME